MIETRVHGSVEAGFEAVQEAFTANFERHADKGAACCVYAGGRKVVDLWGGTYTPDTLQMLDFDAPVTRYWPEFAAQGKQEMPVRWLFSHRAGLPAVDRPLSLEDVLAWHPVVDALAAQKPLWEPNAGHGYHVGTYGWLAGELIRRVSGLTVGEFVAEHIARPLGLELWIGLPEAEEEQVAPMIPPPAAPAGAAVDIFTARMLDPTTLLHRAFVNPPLPASVFNERAFHAAEIPAANGITNARSLARMYAATIGAVDGVRLLKAETVSAGLGRVVGMKELPALVPLPADGGRGVVRPLRDGWVGWICPPRARAGVCLRHEPDAAFWRGGPPHERPGRSRSELALERVSGGSS